MRTRRFTQLVSLVFSLLVALPAVHAEVKELKIVRRVVLDPGHGGENNGALSYNGVFEKQIVLQIALKVEKLLAERTDGKVLMTRRDDVSVPLARRILQANEWGADLFISLHCNSAYSQTAQGVEVLVLSDQAMAEESHRVAKAAVQPKGAYADAANAGAASVLKDMMQFSARSDAEHFAQIAQKRLVKRTGFKDRGVRQLSAIVLRGAEMPGVVMELGFLSNPKEAERLTSERYQWKIAKAIVDAIIRFDRALENERNPDNLAGTSGSRQLAVRSARQNTRSKL